MCYVIWRQRASELRFWVQYHYEIGTYITTLPIQEVIVIGERAKKIAQGIQDKKAGIEVYAFSENEEAVMYLMGTLMPEDIVLGKGSNGMHMNEIVHLLEQ
mgnify:CR=1 FL=1